MVNIAGSLVSNSTQLDNVDLMGGARVFTIVDVDYNEGAEQPLSVRLAEYDRPWKPGLTMRRLLSGIWGEETDEWIGRRVRLFRDETVSFGRQKTGGTRVSHASHIDKPTTLTLPISKAKFDEFKVEPLRDETPTPAAQPTLSDADIEAAQSVDDLRAMWNVATDAQKVRIRELVAELEAADAQPALTESEGQG